MSTRDLLKASSGALEAVGCRVGLDRARRIDPPPRRTGVSWHGGGTGFGKRGPAGGCPVWSGPVCPSRCCRLVIVTEHAEVDIQAGLVVVRGDAKFVRFLAGRMLARTRRQRTHVAGSSVGSSMRPSGLARPGLSHRAWPAVWWRRSPDAASLRGTTWRSRSRVPWMRPLAFSRTTIFAMAGLQRAAVGLLFADLLLGDDCTMRSRFAAIFAACSSRSAMAAACLRVTGGTGSASMAMCRGTSRARSSSAGARPRSLRPTCGCGETGRSCRRSLGPRKVRAPGRRARRAVSWSSVSAVGRRELRMRLTETPGVVPSRRGGRLLSVPGGGHPDLSDTGLGRAYLLQLQL